MNDIFKTTDNIFLVGANGSKIKWLSSILKQEHDIETYTLSYKGFEDTYKTLQNDNTFILIETPLSNILDSLKQDGLVFESALEILKEDIIKYAKFDIKNKVNYVIKNNDNYLYKIISKISNIVKEVK